MSRPIISPEQTPTTAAWELYTLYKQPARGGLRMWQVGFDGIDHLEIRYGCVDGAIQFDRTEVKLNNSKRSMQEQALLEARSRYLKKYREGYEPKAQPGALEEEVLPRIKVMKGVNYVEGMIKVWPVLTQPKLDGIRMIASLAGGVLSLKSRLNNSFNHLLHLQPEIVRLLQSLPPDVTLDGELYSQDMSFQQLCSAVKRVKKPHPRLCEIQYYIFDINMPGPCEERYNLLAATMGYPQIAGVKTFPMKKDIYPALHLVPSRLAFSHEEIIAQHNDYVAEGYEGIMIKKIAWDASPDDLRYTQSLYKDGRTQNILKYKDFQDEEVDVLDVEEAEGNQKGAAVFVVRDPRGNKFTVSMRGQLAQRREWFQHPECVIGKKLTIRFQELTDGGVPRFPVGIAFRDYE